MKTPPIPCDVAIEKSVPWLEGELSPSEMEQISEHLESCTSCAELYRRLDAIDMSPPSTRLSLGPDYWKSMDKALNQEMSSQWGKRKWAPFTRKVAPYAIALSLLVGWAIYERSQASRLSVEMSEMESQIQVQQELIERLQRAQQQPMPLDSKAFVTPVAHVPERYAL